MTRSHDACPVARPLDAVPAPLPARVVLDGQALSLATPADTLAAVDAALSTRRAFTLFTLNLDHLVLRRRNTAFREAYRRATFVTADGAPVAAMARRQDPDFVRTTGADLLLPILALAAARAVPVYLFGAREDTLAAVAQRLADTMPGLTIAGWHAPPMGFDPDGPEADAAIDRIAASGAGLVVIALSPPRQEVFADRLLRSGLSLGALPFGAALDFVVGAQVRAPIAFQRLGLEWLWRLGSHPARLGTRYARCALLLADLALRGMARPGGQAESHR